MTPARVAEIKEALKLHGILMRSECAELIKAVDELDAEEVES